MTGASIDWSVLQIEGVEQAGRNAALKVAREYRGIADRDDLQQDAMIHLATNPEKVWAYVADGELGLLSHWVWQRLVDATRTLADRSNRAVSYETQLEAIEL